MDAQLRVCSHARSEKTYLTLDTGRAMLRARDARAAMRAPRSMAVLWRQAAPTACTVGSHSFSSQTNTLRVPSHTAIVYLHAKMPSEGLSLPRV